MRTYAERLQEILSLGVDVELAALGVLGEVERRDLGDVLVLALTLLLLELEGDTADRAALDTLHQMGRVSRNLHTVDMLGNRHSYESENPPRFQVGILTLLRSLLEEMIAISSQMRLLVSKSRVSLG